MKYLEIILRKSRKYFRITNDKFYLKCYGLLSMITHPEKKRIHSVKPNLAFCSFFTSSNFIQSVAGEIFMGNYGFCINIISRGIITIISAERTLGDDL